METSKLSETMSSSWVDSLVNFFFPPTCLSCRRRLALSPDEDKYFCSSCRDEINSAGYLCTRCSSLNLGEPVCVCSMVSKGSPQGITGVYGVAWYEGRWRKLLHRFKYHDRPQLARPLGEIMGSQLRPLIKRPGPIVVTSVPLHPSRLKERGYDQSALLAKSVAKTMELPYYQILRRVRNTATQTSLSRKERRENVTGAFSLSEGIILNNGNGKIVKTGGGKNSKYKTIQVKTLLLVDDIYTTGATINEAAKQVSGGRGIEVWGATTALMRGKQGDR